MSEVKKVDEVTELITLWKKHNIGHVEFDFYCGGFLRQSKPWRLCAVFEALQGT